VPAALPTKVYTSPRGNSFLSPVDTLESGGECMTNTKTILGWLGALVAPFAVITAYLFLSRWPVYNWSAASDYIALAVAIAVGIIGLCVAVRTPLRRLVGSFVYVCAAAFVLFWYSIAFVCSTFGDCL
jgi:hypothetical protein